MLALPPSAVTTYERLRIEVLSGCACPEGLGAIVYHGLIEGLRLLCWSSGGEPSHSARTAAAQSIACDHELLRLLANMVLQVQSEVSHVY